MTDRQGVLARAILIYAAAVNGMIGLWATLSPRGWYDDFPGFGRVWVSVDGPFNEHLVRDVGAWSLGLTVVCVAAALTLSRPLVVTAGVALAVQSVPHLAYHLANTDPYPEMSDKAGSIGGIAVVAALGAVVAFVGARAEQPSAT